MSTINESVSRIRELLLNPREQMPTIKQVFGAVLREYSNFYNAFANASQPFTVKEISLTINSNVTDYLISQEAGKILFVTASNNAASQTYAYPVEFTDLADASTDWWFYYPITAARPEDYNYAGYSTKIAFYRKNGQLYARIPQYYANNTLTITASTGNWVRDIGTEQSAVLTQYHHLPEIRAAIDLVDAARWSDDDAADERKSDRRLQILEKQEQTVLADFDIAKRSLTASDVVYIETMDSYF